MNRLRGRTAGMPDAAGTLRHVQKSACPRAAKRFCASLRAGGRLKRMNDNDFMGEALRLAGCAAERGEVPVGAVVVCDGQIVGTGFNRRETGKNALAHAELEAIDAACRRLGGWRLHRCELYVTLEPCPMCAGAIINARIRRLVFGARDPKSGCFGSVSDFNALAFNHKPQVVCGVRGEECAQILSAFFQKLRRGRQ